MFLTMILNNIIKITMNSCFYLGLNLSQIDEEIKFIVRGKVLQQLRVIILLLP